MRLKGWLFCCLAESIRGPTWRKAKERTRFLDARDARVLKGDMNSRTALVLAIALLATNATVLPAAEAALSAPSKRAFGPIHPRVAPDGSRIAVSYQGAICTLPAEGGVLTRLTTAPGWDVEPAWSPDTQRIAFVNAGNFTAGELQIIAAADGKPARPPQGARRRGTRGLALRDRAQGLSSHRAR
ncbi:MAG: hypothetical protein FJ386_14585 [Verrucomicrobia bacterium]|nr:hypothetical protein [Verrucomicrobiota bacterium]